MVVNYFKKTGWKRFLFMLLGNLILGLGTAVFKISQMGTDPFNGMNMAIANHLPISYANWQIVLNIGLFLIELWLGRRLIGAGTIVNAVLLGYVCTYSYNLLTSLVALPTALWQRVIVVLLGVIICSFGLSMYQTSDAGVAPYDALSIIMAERIPKVSYFWHRMITDGICALVCFLSGGVMGLGTVVTVFGLGPVIQFFNVHVCEKMIAKKQ